MADNDTSWMDPPTVPETRPCPRCDGTRRVAHKQRLRLLNAVDALLELLPHTPVENRHHQARLTSTIMKNYPDQPCDLCHATGVIPMEPST